MKSEQEVEVLVIGAGPAGLTAAITLGRNGVPCLLVERHTTRLALPRATVVSLRSMELIRSWGLTDAVLAGAEDVTWRLWRCTTLAEAVSGQGFPVGIPSRSESAVLSPTAPECVPQDHLEQVLVDYASTLPACRMETGVELVALTNGPDGATATLRDISTGAHRLVHARYVVAADGAHSRVRDLLDIPMRGDDHLTEGLSVLFRAPLWEVAGDHRYGIYGINHPEAFGTLLPAGQGDRWVYGIEWDPARERLEDYTPERVSRLIRLAVGVPTIEPVIERIGTFSFAALLADWFRVDSTFLVGDAAHRITPRGGTGMNTAIADGYDIGWKLAWVLRGWAEPELLESYEAERRPAAEHNLERSADPNGSVRPVEDEVQADLGGRIRHVWLPGRKTRTSTLDLLGEGLTVLTGTLGTAWELAADAAARNSGMPVAVRPLDRFTARALGLRSSGALLVRPDGVPAGCWLSDGDAAGALALAVDSARGAPRPTPLPLLSVA